MASLRLFVAVPLPTFLEAEVDEMLKKMPKDGGVRWVPKFQLHVTLRFIGGFEDKLVPELEDLLSRVAAAARAFEASIGGFGAFPRLERPRVLFVPVTRGEEGFRRLERELTTVLEGTGVDPDKKEYHPHLTLGRVKENEDPRFVVQKLQEVCPIHWKPWTADRFILFKSQLAPQGPIYTPLREFRFGGN
jgi:2'-5' RNA ligase